MTHFTYITAEYLPKNKACEQAIDAARLVERKIVDDAGKFELIEGLRKAIKEIIRDNPRCKPLRLVVRNLREEPDTMIDVDTDAGLSVLRMMIYQAKS